MIMKCAPLVTLDEVRKQSRNDKVLSKVMDYIKNGFPRVVNDVYTVYAKNKPFLNIYIECLFFGEL